MSSWQIVLLEPARTILTQISQFLVKAFGVLVILLMGWLLARLVKTVVTKGLRLAKLDEVSDGVGLEALLEKGGITHSFSELVGIICYWLALLVAFMVAINAVGLTVAADLLRQIIAYIPNIIAAIFILVLGMFISTILKNIVQTAANNAGLSQTKLLSKIVEVIVIAFSIFIALEQLKIGIRIKELTLSIILGSVGFGLALAFGLGCKEIAGKYVAELIEKMKSKK